MLSQSKEEYPQQCCGSLLLNPRSRLDSNGLNGNVQMCSHTHRLYADNVKSRAGVSVGVIQPLSASEREKYIRAAFCHTITTC